MFFITGLLFVLSGLFYAAGHGELGLSLRPLCQYGDTFCVHPEWLLYAGVICLVWTLFLNVDRL
jgi:membrane protease YdiL (CAAX protease family)